MNTKRSTDTRRLFNFYTYCPYSGKDVVMPIRGVDEADAWNTFDKLYTLRDGSPSPVDQVIEVK